MASGSGRAGSIDQLFRRINERVQAAEIGGFPAPILAPVTLSERIVIWLDDQLDKLIRFLKHS